jgi:NlpC/P60 family protein
MHFKAKSAGLLLTCVLVPAVLTAQQSAQYPKYPDGNGKLVRPAKPGAGKSFEFPVVTTSQGLSVIGAALDWRNGDLSELDCSHLVHAVYERAGFPYAYASSFDLYAGIGEFQKVTNPHVGDLVVWPGHAGIVVDPLENTFFSALSAGIGVESYASAYWKERGKPRFFRYAKTPASDDKQRSANSPSLTQASLDRPADGGPTLSMAVNPAIIQSPTLQIIDSAKPQARDVTQALTQFFRDDPNDLRQADVFKLTRPLVVYSRLEAKTVKIHGRAGQVLVQITAVVSLDGGQVNAKEWQQTQSWTIRRRDKSSWELVLPNDAIYLPRDAMVRVLAHQLSLLADANPAPNLPQRSKLLKMLNIVLVD